ncbi:MAG TPA: condensation domain-containing protein, partial [Ktedonobacteraceae bacterium]|nr:condensation domain-containing protein [Ktedonobacteraceae bacterium]
MQTVTGKRSPLSQQQTRLWSLSGEPADVSAQCAVCIEGALRVEVMRQALQEVVQQHEILHTVFDCLPGMDLPVQIETAPPSLACPVIDLMEIDPAFGAVQMEAVWNQWCARSFDLAQGPVVFCLLVRISQDQTLLLLRLSAFSADTISLRVLVNQLCQTYTALVRQQAIDTEPLQYTDVTAWQEDLLQEEEAAAHLAYWHALAEPEPLPLHLPGELPRPTGSFHPASCPLPLEPETQAQILQVARQAAVTPEALVLACWQLLLARFSATPSFLMGVGCDGRYYDELSDAIGLYTRYVPLRADLPLEQPFTRLLLTVQQALQEGRKRQHYYVASAAHDSSFAFSFLADPWPSAFEGAGVQFRLHQRSSWLEPFLVQLALLEQGTQVQLELHYDQSRLQPATIERLATGMQRLLACVLATPTLPLSQLPQLGEAEEQWLFQHSQGDTLPVPVGSFAQLFEQQVRTRPEAPALQGARHTWSYAQLNALANQWAHLLQSQGVGVGSLVGICLPRGPLMLVCVLALFKVGAGYVPLEPEQPAERLALVLAQTQLSLLLTAREVAAHLPLPPSWNGQVLCLEEQEAAVSRQAQENLAWTGSGEELAYVIYTSGSTGVPKGVMVRQRNLLNYTYGLLQRIGGQPGWHYATVSTLAADLGHSAIFGA